MIWEDEDYFNRVEQAIEKAQTMQDIEYIEDKIKYSKNRPPYRSNENKAKRDELLVKCQEKAEYYISKGAVPF